MTIALVNEKVAALRAATSTLVAEVDALGTRLSSVTLVDGAALQGIADAIAVETARVTAAMTKAKGYLVAPPGGPEIP